MENKIAIIKNNVIDQIIIASDEYASTLSEKTVNITGLEEVGIGWNYNNGEFTDSEGRTLDEVKKYYASEYEKTWRRVELQDTDWIVPVTDHPQHAAYMTYRQELRDYPSQPDFPNGQRPVKP